MLKKETVFNTVPVSTLQHTDIIKLRGKIEQLLPLSKGITLIGIKDPF